MLKKFVSFSFHQLIVAGSLTIVVQKIKKLSKSSKFNNFPINVENISSPANIISQLSPLTLEDVCIFFSNNILLLEFSDPYQVLLEVRTKFIKFCAKFWVNQIILQASECTSLLVRSKPVQWNLHCKDQKLKAKYICGKCWACCLFFVVNHRTNHLLC